MRPWRAGTAKGDAIDRGRKGQLERAQRTIAEHPLHPLARHRPLGAAVRVPGADAEHPAPGGPGRAVPPGVQRRAGVLGQPGGAPDRPVLPHQRDARARPPGLGAPRLRQALGPHAADGRLPLGADRRAAHLRRSARSSATTRSSRSTVEPRRRGDAPGASRPSSRCPSRGSCRSASSRPTGSFAAPTSVRDTLYSLPPAHLPDTRRYREDMAAFKASVRSLDQGIGAVLNALHRRGVADRTLVVCTTDHGLAFPGAKATLFDRGTGVMLLMRGRAGSPAGGWSTHGQPPRRVPDAVRRRRRVAHPDWLQGRSLLPLVQGEHRSAARRDLRRAHFHAAYEPAARHPHRALEVHPALRRPPPPGACRTATTARPRTCWSRTGGPTPSCRASSSTTWCSTPRKAGTWPLTPSHARWLPTCAPGSRPGCADTDDPLARRARRAAVRARSSTTSPALARRPESRRRRSSQVHASRPEPLATSCCSTPRAAGARSCARPCAQPGWPGGPEEYFEALRASGRPRRPEEYFAGIATTVDPRPPRRAGRRRRPAAAVAALEPHGLRPLPRVGLRRRHHRQRRLRRQADVGLLRRLRQPAAQRPRDTASCRSPSCCPARVPRPHSSCASCGPTRCARRSRSGRRCRRRPGARTAARGTKVAARRQPPYKSFLEETPPGLRFHYRAIEHLLDQVLSRRRTGTPSSSTCGIKPILVLYENFAGDYDDEHGPPARASRPAGMRRQTFTSSRRLQAAVRRGQRRLGAPLQRHQARDRVRPRAGGVRAGSSRRRRATTALTVHRPYLAQ